MIYNCYVSYDSIIETIIVNTDKRFHGDIETRLLDIENKKIKDEFKEFFLDHSDLGLYPYDILLEFFKNEID